MVKEPKIMLYVIAQDSWQKARDFLGLINVDRVPPRDGPGYMPFQKREMRRMASFPGFVPPYLGRRG
jgi:hypothetical protein